MKSRIALLDKILERKYADAFLITSPRSVQHLCGYFFNFETGPSPFHLIPAALVVLPALGAYLVIADNESGQLTDLNPEIMLVPYKSYSYDKPLEYGKHFKNCIFELVKSKGRRSLTIGIEPESLPAFISISLREKYPDIEFVDITADVQDLRLIKDDDELNMIRAATRLCDIGQAAVTKHARTGISELDLFSMVRWEIESAAGRRVPMMADLVSGTRTGEGGGNPSTRVMNPRDLVMSDLTPCLDGYWGDTCSTIVLGKPTAGQQELFNKIKDTLEMGIKALKPGVRACDIDSLMRKQLAPMGEYSHHSGHGVGLAYHEEPRIVPYNETELRPNMVIALEPGIYNRDFGIRLEHLAVITENGSEVISKFDHFFEIGG